LYEQQKEYETKQFPSDSASFDETDKYINKMVPPVCLLLSAGCLIAWPNMDVPTNRLFDCLLGTMVQ
jgi:hypothetical protein